MKTKVVNVSTRARYDVYIGRGSRWGNPYRLSATLTRRAAVRRYALRLIDDLLTCDTTLVLLGELAGKTLGCHCVPAACHGDVIAHFADSLSMLSDVCPDPRARSENFRRWLESQREKFVDPLQLDLFG